MNIEIPDDEAVARREREMKHGDTLDDLRRYHDQAVAEGRLVGAFDWSLYIALLEWTPPAPPREFKVGDVVHWTGAVTQPKERIVKGVDGDYISFGCDYAWMPATSYVLVKAVDDAE